MSGLTTSAPAGATFALVIARLGVAVGALTVVLGLVVDGAAAVFSAHHLLAWLFPIMGFASFGLYRVLRIDFSWSTARVVAAVQAGERVPFALAWAIIAGTGLTVLGGGSAGKEAAALQMGAAVSGAFERHVAARWRAFLAPSALAAALGAMLDAPLAGVVFSFEVLRRRPCGAASLVAPIGASLVAWAVVAATGMRFTGVVSLACGDFGDGSVLAWLMPLTVLALLAGVAAGVLARVFCWALEAMRAGLARLGAPVFALAAGGVAAALILSYADVFGYGDVWAFCGTGSAQIVAAFGGCALPWWAFAAKVTLTLLTFAGGYKGGEIMPVLAIGACLGSAIAALGAPLMGAEAAVFQPVLAAVTMASFFAACTKCPLTAFVLVVGLFRGTDLLLVVCLAAPTIVLARVVSPATGLYPTTSGERC